MRALLMCVIISIAGCATLSSRPHNGPDTYYDNETKWQAANRQIQEECRLQVIKSPPMNPTMKMLEQQLESCLMKNSAFF